MSAPILEVSSRGQTRYIPGSPQPTELTAVSYTHLTLPTSDLV